MEKITVNRQMNVAENYKELCDQVVQNIFTLAHKCIKENGSFTLGLSGGATPQGVYELMGRHSFSDQFDWQNIYLFLVDERWVPILDERSNCGMILDKLISKINIPISNFHAIKTDAPNAQLSASLYEKELINHFRLMPNEFPQFDLILLGLGQDGHTASLFPNNPAFKETKHLVVSVEMKASTERRVTLTLPVINHARHIFFLVSGSEKAEILQEIVVGNEKKVLPAQLVNPHAEVSWFVDKDAASLIEDKYET